MAEEKRFAKEREKIESFSDFSNVDRKSVV